MRIELTLWERHFVVYARYRRGLRDFYSKGFGNWVPGNQPFFEIDQIEESGRDVTKELTAKEFEKIDEEAYRYADQFAWEG